MRPGGRLFRFPAGERVPSRAGNFRESRERNCPFGRGRSVADRCRDAGRSRRDYLGRIEAMNWRDVVAR